MGGPPSKADPHLPAPPPPPTHMLTHPILVLLVFNPNTISDPNKSRGVMEFGNSEQVELSHAPSSLCFISSFMAPPSSLLYCPVSLYHFPHMCSPHGLMVVVSVNMLHTLVYKRAYILFIYKNRKKETDYTFRDRYFSIICL